MPLECDHIRNEFSALLDNELNPEDRELVEEHLSDCSECLRELHGYKVVSDAYRFHHPVMAPEDFEERFHAAIAPIGRKRGFAWRQWSLLAAAGFTLVAGVVVWQSQSRLAQVAAPEMASSMSADSAMAPEAAPAADAPQTMMFKSPSGGAGPEGGAMLEDNIQPTEAPLERQALELGAELKSSDVAESRLEQTADSDTSGAGGGAVVMSAPAPPVAPPAAAAPMKAARKVDDDSVALKSEAAEGTVAESAMRTKEASPASLLWNDQTFDLVAGTWRQANYADEVLTKIAIPSAAWNALLDEHSDLAALCDRDEPVIVKLGEVWYSIAKVPAE